MRLRNCGSKVVARAPAKVNLFLEVLAKRADGYHEIATLMVAVRLYDRLVFQDQVDDRLELQCDRSDLTTGPDNLVLKAARLLRDKTQCKRGARICLKKRIPMAAGLAGGSSDAAATLAGLNRLWQLGRSDEELALWGSEIGSDIPFFFHGPAAWCTGRGEKVTPVACGRTLHLVLVCPHVGLATALVYRNVTVPNEPLAGDAIKEALAGGAVERLGELLHNRLQPVAQRLCPEVATWHQRLRRLNAAGQLMSGSGTSLFVLCRDRAEAVTLSRQLRSETDKEQADVYLVRTEG